MTTSPPGSQRHRLKAIAEALVERKEDAQWEELIVSMLSKLELPREKYAAAKARYEQLGRHVAKKLGMADADVHVVVQGSMRTGTTIAGDGREKFDLDAVVKLCGGKYDGLKESEAFFSEFGESLEGIEDAGEPDPKRRCWRLPFTGEPFYFDVTPAIPTSEEITGTSLRVRDPDTIWSPSNPEDFADWFCEIADKRFPFQQELSKRLVEAKTIVEPLPAQRTRIDDILRRTVQLLKLHRDGYYKHHRKEQADAKPISVILVTLAAKAYDDLLTSNPRRFRSSVEVVAELVERMPDFIDEKDGNYFVNNPRLRGNRTENFAERWNSDGGLRKTEFFTWHDRLEQDLEALFSEEYSRRSEARVRAIFGEHGVNAWKASQPSQVFSGLLGAGARGNPTTPRNSGSKDKLA